MLEYAETFHVAPQDVIKTTRARWWYRWQTWSRAKQTREAYGLAKQYGANVPPELREVMAWAHDADAGGEYVLDPLTQTYEKVKK